MDVYERQHSANTCGKLLKETFILWSLQTRSPHKKYVDLYTLQGKRAF